MIQKYSKIVFNYRQLRIKQPDTWLIHSKNQKNITSAIHTAAFALNHETKRHPHQYRLKKIDMQLFVDKLISSQSNIQTSQTFDELYNRVASCKVHGIGKLAIYDTAHRLGVYLNLEPEYIYIHAGTKIGLEELMGKKVNSNKIEKESLPELNTSDLSPAELEDLLCHMAKKEPNGNYCFMKGNH
jgi:hypothetical protein